MKWKNKTKNKWTPLKATVYRIQTLIDSNTLSSNATEKKKTIICVYILAVKVYCLIPDFFSCTVVYGGASYIIFEYVRTMMNTTYIQ